MTDTTTQNTRLLAHFRSGKTITVREGMNRLGIGSTPRRILDLKEAGHNITDVWETGKGTRYKRWSLIRGAVE